MIPRKGFDILAEALARGRVCPHLSIAGDTTRDSATATALKNQINRLDLADRITMLGTLSPEALDRVYSESDAFVLASHYEGYGMAYVPKPWHTVCLSSARRAARSRILFHLRRGFPGRTRKSRGSGGRRAVRADR